MLDVNKCYTIGNRLYRAIQKLETSETTLGTYLVLDSVNTTHVLDIYNITTKNIDATISKTLNITEISHNHIASYSHCGEISGINNSFGVLREHFPLGTLRQLIGTDIEANFKMKFIYQTLLGLDALHKRNILHKNLTPHSINFKEIKGNTAYVAVLGHISFTELLDHYSTSMGSVGIQNYLAPEVLSSNNHSVQSDLFSLGVTSYELLTGSLPYSPHNLTSLYNAENSKLSLPSNLAQTCGDYTPFIKKLIHPDKEQRHPTVHDAINQLYFIQAQKKK